MNKRPFISSLTSIRYLAALFVVFFHYHEPAFAVQQDNAFLKFFDILSDYGFAGVSFFFILSGFILFYNYNNGNALRVSPRAFWVARFARIYPLYLFAFIVSIPIFLTYIKDHSLFGVAKFLSKAGMEVGLVQSWVPLGCGVNCPGWSLSVETFFYALFPFIAILLMKQSTRKNIIIFFAAWVVAILVPAIYQYLNLTDDKSRFFFFAAYNPLLHLPQFCMGVITSILFFRKKNELEQNAIFYSIIGWVPLMVLFGLLLIVVLRIELPYPYFNNGLLAPLFAALIAAIAFRQSQLTRILNKGWLVLLGDSSYAVYILQFPLAGWWSRLLHGTWIATFFSSLEFLVYTVVLSIISVAAFLFLEKPAKRLLIAWFDSKFALEMSY